MSYHSMGAVGPGGYPARTLCLTDQNGMRVKSLYARDPLRYGNIYSLYDVCFKTRSTKTLNTRVNVSYGSNRKQCLSIYDLYGQRVCFTPSRVAPKAPITIAPTPVQKQPASMPQPVRIDSGRQGPDDDITEITADLSVEDKNKLLVALTQDQLVADTPANIITTQVPQQSQMSVTSSMIPEMQQASMSVPEDPAEVFDDGGGMPGGQQEQASPEDDNKKVLLIGGILAAIVVAGGVAYVATRKK